MITPAEIESFFALRRLVFDKIKVALDESEGHCKSYEGHMAVRVEYPNYFEKSDEPTFSIELNCYLLGPTRHYKWYGKILTEAIDTARADILSW